MRVKRGIDDPFEDDDLLEHLNYPVFRPYTSIGDLHEVLKDAKKAIRLGIIIEENSEKFYHACMERVSDENAKEEFSRIIEEEQKHKLLLEDIIAKL